MNETIAPIPYIGTDIIAADVADAGGGLPQAIYLTFRRKSNMREVVVPKDEYISESR